MKADAKVSIVIVTYNSENDIEECLTSLKEQTYKSDSIQIIIVDDNSTDDTVKRVQRLQSRIPNITLLRQSSNLFLTAGNNKGMDFALKNQNPKYILCLNPDTKADKNLIEELVNIAESDPSIGAVGPKVKFYKNPNEGLINSTGIIYDGFNQAYDRGWMEEDKNQYNNIEDVFAVTGACILYKVEVLKKSGLYWEKIKMYLDEIELAIRIRKCGYRIIYTPSTTLWHKYMQSTDKNKELSVVEQKRKAWLLIALKHYSLKSKLAMLKHYYFG